MAETVKTRNRVALSGWPMFFGWLAMLIFAIHASTRMVAAGDTWVAMACGRHFLNHGVDTVEPFSANSHRPGPTEEEIRTWPGWAQWITDKVGTETVKYWHPTGWLNQNWLTHVIFYWLTHKSPFADADTFSFNTLVYWKFAIYILTVVCVYYTGRLLGVNPALSVVFACFAMFVGRTFFDIRPAGFSNLLVAVFVLILALATYRNILYIWLIVPLAVFWCNVHGGYIYLFIMLIPFAGLQLLTNLPKKWTAILYNVAAWPFFCLVVSKAGLTLPTFLFLVLLIVLDFTLIFSKKNLVCIKWKGVFHTIAASFVSFLAVVIFNPFHLTNLTHTFVISVSKHAEMWRMVHEWHPAFAWDNPVGDEIPFLIMYIISWVALPVWAVVLMVTSRSVGRRYPKRKPKNSDEYQWPKVDIALMVIAAFTIYMAIRSRRFIPIAAIAACPVLAMFIDQIVRAISAARNFHKQNSLSVSPMPYKLQLFFILAGAAAVSFFGTWRALKFKRVYLDFCHTDTKFNSIFMRMTASHVKPFYACRFIKDNKLEGKIFNYWTEGGFIAYGQQPDPNTGKTPLQLFMDGRAQAAYEPRAYMVWSNIMFGGRIAARLKQNARVRKRGLTSDEYAEIGRWMTEELRNHEVWVVLMPLNDKTADLVKAIEQNPDWCLVFFNNKQKLFVDVKDPRGEKLFEKCLRGEALYPNDFSRWLINAHNIFLFGQGEAARRQGLNFAIKAFELNPSQMPMLEIVSARRFAELVPQINDFCKKYFDDFTKNEQLWAKQDGYYHRVLAASIAANHLQQVAKMQRDAKLVEFYGAQRKHCTNEIIRLNRTKRW